MENAALIALATGAPDVTADGAFLDLKGDLKAIRRKVALKLYEKQVEKVYTKVARGADGVAAVLSDAFDIKDPRAPANEKHAKLVKHCTKLEEKAEKVSPQATEALWITVSGQNHTVEDLQACAKKFRKQLKGARWTMYTLEQCGGLDDKPLGHRPHLHMLIVLDKSVQQGEPARMERTVRGAFHPLLESMHTLKISRIGKEARIKSKIRYLLGDKDDEHKHALTKNDEVWRDKAKLEQYYGTVDENDFDDPLGSKSK